MSAVAVERARTRGSALATAWAFVKRHVLTVYSILFFAYLLLPIAVVALFSFNHPPGKFNFTWNQFTWDNWRYWNGVPGIESSIILSLEIALIASVIATALGTLIALALVRYGFRGRASTNILIFLPLSTPEIVLGASLLTFIPAAGDFINAQILGTSDQYMIGNVIQSRFLELTDYPTAAALSFILMAIILALVAIYARALGTEKLTG